MSDDAENDGKPPAKSPVGRLVPQPHGGALRQGRTPNPFRGGGRPKNELRKALQRVSEDAIPMIAAVIDGQVVKRVRVPLREVLKHARCATCDGQLRALRPDRNDAQCVGARDR